VRVGRQACGQEGRRAGEEAGVRARRQACGRGGRHAGREAGVRAGREVCRWRERCILMFCLARAIVGVGKN
jgi:hypothetical protein